ncbi:transposase, partial [Candidatus Poribacteria bacterium]|nr:transposase [Candidatus Poribacteria bacterium]
MDADRRQPIEEIERLRSENADLKASVERLTTQNEQLTKQVDKLTAALEEARQAGKRQAAPFRKKTKSQKPKKPGRKPGDQYGQQARRAVPTPDQITEHYEVPLPEACTCCECIDIEPGEPVVQYQVEIPQAPIYRQFTIETGRCKKCGKMVRGRHELQTSDATGA